MDNYSYCAGIVRGCGKKGPCQDGYIVKTTPDYIIAAAADGHGGEKYIYSHEGAFAACDAVAGLFQELFDEYSQEEIFNMLTINSEIWLAKRLEARWKAHVLRRHEALCRETLSDIYELYGTTLLSVIICGGFIFALQIGDGDIVAATANGAERLFEAIALRGSETYSLCQKESWKYIRTKLIKDGFPRLISLSTDGLANSFLKDQGFLQVSTDILSICDEEGIGAVSENINSWLLGYTTGGGKDDIGMVILYKGGEA